LAAVFGFNVGAVISLGDMEKTIEFISENSEDITENKDNIDDITEKFMLKDLPQPITVNNLNMRNELREQGKDDEDEFEIDDSDFDDIFGDDEDYEEEVENDEDEFEIADSDFDDIVGDDEDYEEEVGSVQVNKIDLLEQLKKEKELKERQEEEVKQRAEIKREQELRNAEQERLRREKEQEDAEIAALKRQLDEERKARKKAEELVREKQKAELLKEIEAEKEKSAEIVARLREEKIKELKEAKRRELIAKKKKEMLNDKVKQAAKEKPKAEVNIYDTMEIEALYTEVRKFMSSLGVSRSIVDTKTLDDKFGKHNIRKLILKSYLISIGKGVTIGR